MMSNINDKGLVLVISSPSGAGKTTICKKLIDEVDGIDLSVSVTTRKKKNFTQNKGEITFLRKWGFSTKFFKKHYLRSKTEYKGPLKEPIKNLSYYFDLLICKLKLFFI